MTFCYTRNERENKKNKNWLNKKEEISSSKTTKKSGINISFDIGKKINNFWKGRAQSIELNSTYNEVC